MRLMINWNKKWHSDTCLAERLLWVLPSWTSQLKLRKQTKRQHNSFKYLSLAKDKGQIFLFWNISGPGNISQLWTIISYPMFICCENLRNVHSPSIWYDYFIFTWIIHYLIRSTLTKHPAYGIHSISHCVRLVAPIQINVCQVSCLTCNMFGALCRVSPVTSHISLTPTATARDLPPANSPSMHSRMLRLILT